MYCVHTYSLENPYKVSDNMSVIVQNILYFHQNSIVDSINTIYNTQSKFQSSYILHIHFGYQN
jgi:hypothetical protein